MKRMQCPKGCEAEIGQVQRTTAVSKAIAITKDEDGRVAHTWSGWTDYDGDLEPVDTYICQECMTEWSLDDAEWGEVA